MNYRVNAENMMRKNRLMRRIKAVCVALTFFFLFEIFLFYNYLCYMQTHESLGAGILDFFASTVYVFRLWNLPFFSALGDIGSLFINTWYVHIFVILLSLLSLRRIDKFKGMEHGSARWASNDELRLLQTDKQTGIIPIAHNIYVDPDNTSLENLNEFVIGGSGAGKSFRKLLPDIMHECADGLIITDVKGSLFQQSAKILEKKGFKIRLFNLDNLKLSNAFNPIPYCEDDTDIDKLVNTFVINSRREGGQPGEAFWEDTLSMLLFAAIKYITVTPGEELTFYRCLRLASSIQIVGGAVAPYCEIERLMTELDAKDPYSSAVLTWKLVKQAPPETLQSVVISMTSRLRLWANEDLQILTSTDEMDFESLVDEKTAIFLIVPEGDNTYRCISSMFIYTAVMRLKSLAKNKYGGRLPRLVSLELDEFCNCGILPKWSETVSTIRSQNIRAMMIVQDLQQMEQNYKDSFKTIINNCAIYNYLGTTDEDTIKKLVNKLGKTTISETNVSYSLSGMGKSKHNVSERGLARDLMTFSELEHKPKEKSLVFLNGFNPIYADKFKTQNHPLFSFLGNDDTKAANAKNNTDIEAYYMPLFEKHRAEYLANRKRIEAQNEDLFEDTGGPIREISEDELKQVTKSVKGICQRHHISISVATIRQEEALNSIMPFGMDCLRIRSYYYLQQ